MKILPIFSFSLAVSLFSSCSPATSSSTTSSSQDVVFIDTLHHFGEIPLSSPIDTFDFKFVNSSQYAVLVFGAKPSCECTHAFYTHDPVMPGDTSFIRVIYDGSGRQPEYFNKTVSVTLSCLEEDVILSFDGELK